MSHCIRFSDLDTALRRFHTFLKFLNISTGSLSHFLAIWDSIVRSRGKISPFTKISRCLDHASIVTLQSFCTDQESISLFAQLVLSILRPSRSHEFSNDTRKGMLIIFAIPASLRQAPRPSTARLSPNT